MKNLFTYSVAVAICFVFCSAVFADMPADVNLDYKAVQIDANTDWIVEIPNSAVSDPIWNSAGDTLTVPNTTNSSLLNVWFAIDMHEVFNSDLQASLLTINDWKVGIDGDIVTPTFAVDPLDNTKGTLTWMWQTDNVLDDFDIVFKFNNNNVVETFDMDNFVFPPDSDGKISVDRLTVATQAVPTPSALVLCGIGLGFMGVVRRIRRK